MIFNLGSSTPTFPLMISGYPNAVVTVTNGKKTYTLETDNDGNATFEKMTKGTWTVTVTAGDESTSLSVDISKESSNTLDINAIPKFTYTGSYQIVDDDNNEITASINNWKIRFLTSGTLTFTNLNGAAEGIDVFCVGGGGAGGQWCNGGLDGSGGCGGFTNTANGIIVNAGTSYAIIVGAGGLSKTVGNMGGNKGGYTSAFNVTAAGGSGGHAWDAQTPGSGGSGGGSGGSDESVGGNGGSDGNDGGSGGWSGGKGQGTTTREFGESTGSLYAGGGSGSRNTSAAAGGGAASGKNAEVNTGGGGGGGYNDSGTTVNGGAGGSGIVVIRNTR